MRCLSFIDASTASKIFRSSARSPLVFCQPLRRPCGSVFAGRRQPLHVNDDRFRPQLVQPKAPRGISRVSAVAVKAEHERWLVEGFAGAGRAALRARRRPPSRFGATNPRRPKIPPSARWPATFQPATLAWHSPSVRSGAMLAQPLGLVQRNHAVFVAVQLQEPLFLRLRQLALGQLAIGVFVELLE